MTTSPTWNLDKALEGVTKGSALSASNMLADLPEKTAPVTPAPVSTPPPSVAFKSASVFSSLPEKAPAPEIAPPDVMSLGEVFNQGAGYLRDIVAAQKARDYGKAGTRGANAMYHEALKSGVLEKMSAYVEDTYGIAKDQVPTIFNTLVKTNGGLRTGKEMDEIIKIQKEGTSFTGVDGEVTIGPDAPWELALGAHKAKQTAALRGKEPVDLVKRTGEIQGVLKNATDANGEPLPGQEAVFDNAHKALAQLNGIPTETSQYGFAVGRLSKQMSEFENAQAVGAASYGGVTSDQFGARISELQIQIQQKAIKSAPTFNDNSQKNAWLSNPETAGLPFFMGIGGKKALVRATEDPNVMEQFVEKGKSGSPEMVRVDLAASPKTETEKPKSEFTGAGESGQRVRRAVGKVTRGLGEATQSIGNTISDLPYQAVNAASGAAEFGAGVAGYNLNIPKIDTMTEALNKLGLDNRNDFARGKMNLPTVEQIRKDQEMIAKRKKK